MDLMRQLAEGPPGIVGIQANNIVDHGNMYVNVKAGDTPSAGIVVNKLVLGKGARCDANVSAGSDPSKAAYTRAILANTIIKHGEMDLNVGGTNTSERSELLPLTTVGDKKDGPPDVGRTTEAPAEGNPEAKTKEVPENEGCCVRVMTGIAIFLRNLCPTVQHVTLCECFTANANANIGLASGR